MSELAHKMELANIVKEVCRRQHGNDAQSQAEELLMRHPKAAWCANRYYRHGVWQKLRRLGLVTGTFAQSRLTPLGYTVREEIDGAA
jgi:hypothetical protein